MPGISRRQLLGGIGGGAGALAAASLTPIRFEAEAASATPSTQHQWVVVIDMRRCDGCAKCTVACQANHHLPKTHEWIRVDKVTSKSGQEFYMPVPCMQCENAPCIKVCPVGASFKNAEGVNLVDQSKCIGCRMCMAACPYGARYFNDKTPPKFDNPFGAPTPEYPVPQIKGTVGKCMFCVHETAQGKLPACVEACEMLALYIGDFVTDAATNGKETVRLSKFLKDNDAWRFKEELHTGPRVYYISGHGQDLGY
ncbi:MAG TPA: 4Fe-4S dicluster domain-containing protein [Candidatus Limnocylindria bacterium]